MSPRVGSEAESGSAAVARNTDREETRPKLTVWPGTAPQAKTPTPVDRIGKLTPAELAELAPPEARGVQSGAFSKRFGQEALDWSALRNPTPLPPPPAAEPIHVPSAVQPFYGKLPGASERAELHIGDLSLELANPFVGSSLNPPPPAKRPWLRPLLITLGGCLLMGAGYVGAVYHVERHAASAVAKWTGAEVTPVIAVVPDAPLHAATTPSAPIAEPSIAQAAVVESELVVHPTGEAEHTATPVEEVFSTEEGLAVAEPEPSIAAAPAEPPTASAVTTSITESTATAMSPRARRRAARAAARAAAAAAAVAAAQAGAKAVEAKPEVAPAAPAAPAPARAVLAPNPYVSRPVPVVARVAPVALAPVASGPVPQTLSRTQVQNALEGMRGQLANCAAGAHGRTSATVTISGAGRVTYATVDGAFAGTPQGSCMARALRGAQFPQFASPQLRVVYPFAL